MGRRRSTYYGGETHWEALTDLERGACSRGPDCYCHWYWRMQNTAAEHRKTCTYEDVSGYGRCSQCYPAGNSRIYALAHHFFIDFGIEYEETTPGTFLFTHGRKQFYWWPGSNKWRQKGKTKVYFSRGIDHILEILQR